MNPDLVFSLRMPYPHLTILLTCGESDGQNVPRKKPKTTVASGPPAVVSFEGYAAARLHGWRRSYASMALDEPDAEWRREEIQTAGGPTAELATLEKCPRVQLISLNCWNNGASSPRRYGKPTLLWNGEHDRIPTMCPTDSPVREAYTYTRDELITTMVGLLNDFQPTLVRTLDPDPDYQAHDAKNPQHADSGDFSDHEVHTATSLFTFAALQEWWNTGHGATTVVESYRGYYNLRWPANLNPAQRKAKEHYLRDYAAADVAICQVPSGCGDLKMGDVRINLGWYGHSMIRKYPPPPTWLQPGADGRLKAFAVLGGHAVMWSEREPGCGVFTSPVRLGGGPLLPQLSVLRLPDGRLQLFAVRMILAADPAGQARDIVTTVQYPGSDTFSEWTSLGNPHVADGIPPVRRRGAGIPVAGVHPDGRAQVFVRNFGKGVSSRIQDAGGDWGPWLDLHGDETQDGLAVVSPGTGPVEFFLATKTGILAGRSAGTSDAVTVGTLKVRAPASPPTAVGLPQGRLMLAARQANNGAVLGYRRDAAGLWSTAPDQFGSSGQGAVGLLATDDGQIVMVGKREDATLEVCSTDPTVAGCAVNWVWTESPFSTGAPAVAQDGRGHAVIATVCSDGSLWTAWAMGESHELRLENVASVEG